MSAVTEFEPVFDIPERARRGAGPREADFREADYRDSGYWDDRPDATILQIHRPSERAVSVPVRLTQRGVVALGLAVAMLCAALLGVAWLSAPQATRSAASVPAHVSVLSGDTLWSIAERVAPQVDPRAEISRLQQLNHLASVSLVPGQLIRTR